MIPSDAQLSLLYPRLRRFAAVVADLDMDPDDIVQDVFTSLFSRPRQLSNPEAYLRSAVVRRVIYLRRAAARRPRANGRHVESTAPDEPGAEIELHDLLSALGPLDRALVLLVDVDGTPASIAATDLGISHVAARARLSRARARLRKHLGTEA